jgi:hypothetical protein
VANEVQDSIGTPVGSKLRERELLNY